jgi:exopolysaccharide production protein ExoQ
VDGVATARAGRTHWRSPSADTVGSWYAGSAFVLLSGPSGVPVRTSSAALCAVAIAAMGWRRTAARDIHLPGSAVVFVAWCATSVLWSDHPHETLVEAMTLALVTCTAVVAASTFSARSMLRGIIYGAAAVAALSVLEAIVDPSLAIANDHADVALQGIYVQRNILSSALVPGLVATVCGGWALGRGRAVPAVLAFGLAACTLATKSTTALASALAAIAVAAGIAAVMRFPRGQRLLPAVGVGAAAALVGELVLRNFEAVVTDAGRDLTFTGRTDIWAAVWQRIDDDPWLGHGWGAVWGDGDPAGDFVRSYIGYFIDHSHNGALDLMVQVGWVGVGLVVAVLLQLAVVASRVYRAGSSRLGIWPVASVALFVFHNLSESELTTVLGWFLLVTVVVLVLRDAARTGSARAGRDPAPVTSAREP